MKQTLLLLICLCFVALISAVPVWDNPAPVLLGDNIMWNRCGSSTADGGMVYVWSDSHRGSRDLYAQRMDSEGNAVWPQPLLLVDSPYYETGPIIVKSSDNHYIVAYTEYRGDNTGVIKAQKFTAQGARLWQSDGVTVCSNENYYYIYELVPDASGGAYFVWKENRNNAVDIYVQRLNGSGVIQMPVNGITIGDNSGSESSFNAVSDGAGGCLVMYQVNYTGSSSFYIKRVNPNGSVAWAQIVGSGSTYWYSSMSLSPRIGDSFIASWIDNENDVYRLKARKIGLNGTLQWDNPITVAPGAGQTNPELMPVEYSSAVSGGNLIFAWSTGLNYDIYAQKIDSDGNLLWGDNGVTVCQEANYQQSIRIASDNAGGCVITWEDDRINTSYSVYAQYINNTGIAVWQQNGLLLSNDVRAAFNALPRFTGGNFHIAWNDNRTGSSGIYRQIVSPAGTCLLLPGGTPLKQGIDSNSYPDVTVARNNDVAVVWRDFRGSYMGDRIYFQFINPDGSFQLEANGRPVTLTASESQTNPAAVASPDGKLVITWSEGYQLKAQLIDTDGSLLWGNGGMVVADFDIITNTVSKISYDNGAFFVVYDKVVPVVNPYSMFVRRIYANKIQNGQLAWGSAGVLVTPQAGANDLFESTLSAVTGKYVIWQRTDLNPETFGNLTTCAKLLDENGNAAAGWQDAGLAVSDYWNWDAIQINATAEQTDAGLFVIWQDYRTDYISSIYGQLVSPQGVLLWDSGGLELSPSLFEQQQAYLLPGNDRIVIWSENPSSVGTVVKAQKFSADGQPLWGDTGLLLSYGEVNVFSYNPSAQRYENGGIVAVWQSYNDDQVPGSMGIQYSYIHPDGTLVGSSQMISSYNNYFEKPLTALLNDEVYMVWTGMDVVSPFEAPRIPAYEPNLVIYAQKLGNEVVSSQDDVLPVPAVTLEQNCPNPFNPETAISFALKAASEAELSIYNLKGQKVRTLHSGLLDKGRHTLVWNGLDGNGVPAASGVYFYRLSVPGYATQTRKMLLLK